MKIMLCDERQHDMQRAVAFIKRLAAFALCFRPAESMAALFTVKHLLQKNAKCRNLLANDAGGGSVAGAIAKFQPRVLDPSLCDALASVPWELNLLMKLYHPSVSSIASTISIMNANTNQVIRVHASPQQAYTKLLKENESFATSTLKRFNNKREGPVQGSDLNSSDEINESVVRKKLSEHFLLLLDIKEYERLRSEMERTTKSLNLYEKYRKQKKRKTRSD
ncbi:nucleolar complex-associated protein 3 isoform X2 [Salvia divinorum]|uniref:Nucleolar complex-associated protein 3 isoform X2 n=1 Tax=Salvia divinorum TaxID=28513 RepID=A0ABD1HTU1_SALDI